MNQYLRGMDTKSRKRRSHLSALISIESKKRLKRQSERLDQSMTTILEDLIGTLPEDERVELKVAPGKGKEWLQAHQGLFAGLITTADRERQDRFGDLLRKHVRP